MTILPAGSTITIAFGAASTTSRKRRSPADSPLGLVIGIALEGMQPTIRGGRMSIKKPIGIIRQQAVLTKRSECICCRPAYARKARLGSGLIDQSQKATAAAIQIADK